MLAATLAVAFPLASCGQSIGSGDAPKLTTLDARLTTPCRRPAKLPDKDLSLEEVARYWGGDRKSLSECAERLDALTTVIATEREALKE